MNKEYLQLSDFSHDIYRLHPDLHNFTNEELEDHYLKFGIEEGRVFNFIANRKSFINIVNGMGKALEIGPLDNPQLDYTSPDYCSIDVFDRATLIQNYINDSNVNKEKIIEPTYVITDDDYSKIKDKFKVIFSSHNIEHMPCLVTFLNNLSKVLDKEGNIFLVVPDKRYCFDHFKNESDIYDVLQSYYEGNSRPRLEDVLRMRTQGTHNEPAVHWQGNYGENNYERMLVTHYADILALYKTGVYMDSHVSFFTPHSFFKILTLLKELGLINLKIKKLYHTLKSSNEFYAILTNG